MLNCLNKPLFCQAIKAQFSRTHRYFSYQQTALHEKLQLRCRELDLGLAGARPEVRELPPLEALGIEAETSPIPQQYLRSFAVSTHEYKQVAGKWVSTEVGLDQTKQTIESFPHVYRLGISEHLDGRRGADHRMAFRR
jgi:hypothetical protein